MDGSGRGRMDKQPKTVGVPGGVGRGRGVSRSGGDGCGRERMDELSKTVGMPTVFSSRPFNA